MGIPGSFLTAFCWHLDCDSLEQEQKMGELQGNLKNAHWRSQEGLIAAMMNPGFYPKPPPEVIHKETHISHIFLAGDLVYKVKKAVRYSFLDYSTLSKRRHFLQEELRLNRRLAPSVYLAVMPIALEETGWRLGGWDTPNEYTLVMRRLPDRRMLPALLDSGQVTAEMMRRLAEVLAEFHSQAEPVAGIDASRHRKKVEKQWNDNLADLTPWVGPLISAADLKTLADFGSRFISRHGEQFQHRAAQGWIRDVHGDLHCEHICFAPEGIQIYDCIEFDPELRQCDLASEIAFLLMDLEVHGGGALRGPFLKRYLELVKDTELPLLLPFYECYRALVRGKVEALRPETASARAPRYFQYAVAVTWQPLKPFLILVSGLTGSGKSTLSRELGKRLRVPVINSDVVRKDLAGQSRRKIIPFGEGIYSDAMTRKTYARMVELARQHLLSGEGAILDATFSRKTNRKNILELAAELKVPLAVIHCFASDETTRTRLAHRLAQGTDISDGRWEIYQRQKETYQPMEEFPPATRLELDTEPTAEQLAGRTLDFLRSRLEPRPDERD
jgi:aminoglycoside phosphotransferase family enzyme/predicted kinase